uniref:DekiORF39 n=1 Tax=Dendrolimus kikuchii nucleopolyhedrovirus TaxID=1219875 RepID=V9LSS7_9ABAC|nr:DekiORF39 [Dendrolimus kikuchii nucleopolyhedrovirus]
MLWHIIFIFVLILIIYVYALAFAKNFINTDAIEPMQTDTALLPVFDLTFQRSRAVDCSLNRLPCVTDQQCRDNCVISGAASQLSCRAGFCNATPADLLHSEEAAAAVECDPALGLINAFAAGGDFVVAQTCVSTHRDLVDDRGAPRPYLCDSGELTLNLDTVQFSTQSCECAPQHEKLLFRQTALARSLPVCIPVRMANLYARVYDKV